MTDKDFLKFNSAFESKVKTWRTRPKSLTNHQIQWSQLKELEEIRSKLSAILLILAKERMEGFDE